MEPPDVNSGDDPQLEQWLRNSEHEPVADNGFTARVLASLPPAPVRWTPEPAQNRTRVTAIVAGAMAGVVCCWSGGASALFTWTMAQRVGSALADPMLGVAVVATAMTLAALYVPTLRRLWA
jgi:hypothetical protein